MHKLHDWCKGIRDRIEDIINHISLTDNETTRSRQSHEKIIEDWPTLDPLSFEVRWELSKEEPDLERIDKLLSLGADVNAIDQFGYSMVHYCILADECIELLRLLKSRGGRIYYKDKDVAYQPFFIAVKKGHSLEVLKLLMQPGEIALQYFFHVAKCFPERVDILEYLQDTGIDPNTRNRKNRSILALGFEKCSLDHLRYLVMVCGVNFGGNPPDWESAIPSNIRGKYLFIDRPRTSMTSFIRKFRFCILWGAKWNIAKYIYTRMHSEPRLSRCMNVILEQIAFCEFMKWPVHKYSRNLLYRNNAFYSRITACKKELISMKFRRIYKKVTVLDIMTASDAKMLNYVGNNDMMESLMHLLEMGRYPIYRDALYERVNSFVYLSNIHKMGIYVLWNLLPDGVSLDIAEEIAKYLTNKNLYRLSLY